MRQRNPYGIQDSDPKSTRAFKEVPFCSHITSSDNDKDCSKYPCKSEKYKCSVVLKKKVETTLKCFDFDVDSTKTETHACIEDTTSRKKQCKEEYLCTKATSGVNNEECSKYPVEWDKRTTHACVKDTTKEQSCKEEQLCEKINFETPSDT